MKARQYTEEQIINVLKEGEAGAKVSDLCRKYGMSDATYYNWKAKYSGMTASDLKRLKSLEHENRRLKQIVGEQALDIRALKDLLSKKILKPRAKRLAVSYTRESHGHSGVSLLVDISTSVYRYWRANMDSSRTSV